MPEETAAILTKNQREYLKGEREPTQERTMRTRIRERIRAGLGDLALASRTLPEEDWKLLFEDFEAWIDHQRQRAERAERADTGADRRLYGQTTKYGQTANADAFDEGREMTGHLHGTAAFLYLVLTKHADGVESFENVVGTAIEIVETTPTERATASVDVTIEREPRPAELLERFERGEDLTEEELDTLVDAGEVSLVDLVEYAGGIIIE